MIEMGFGRADISVFEPGMCMFGWGQRHNTAREVGVPLHARASVVCDPEGGERFAFVVVELLLVTQGLWEAALDALAARRPDTRLGPHNVILAATHTHSGPSGYGHHFWTNLNAPGWSRVVYEGLRDGIVEAIIQAFDARRPSELSVAQKQVPVEDGAAFNRSWFAYNRNTDVTPVTRERRGEAADRIMTVLAATEPDSAAAFGLVHWFASHGTCVHADNLALHPDHKGLAALALEADGLSVVCAQECCGDVSPNYRPAPGRGHTVGRHDDDLESAQHVADVQVRHARDLLAGSGTPLKGPVQVATRYVDFSQAPVSPRWSFDGRPRTTSPARLGVSMALGTAEGPGPLFRVPWVAAALNAAHGRLDALRARLSTTYERTWDPKFPMLELGHGIDGRLGGLLPVRRRLPAFDETFKWVGDQIRQGRVPPGEWVPQTVPLYLVRIGPLAIAAVPFEMTTVAGRRLRRTLAEALPDDVEHIVITPYSSAYVGYMTTFEEYQVQHYEAAYTLFGPFSLAALRTAYEGLAAQLVAGQAVAGAPPTRLSTDGLADIAFTTPWGDATDPG